MPLDVRAIGLAACFIVPWLVPVAARADDSAGVVPPVADSAPAGKTELNIVPVIGGDSDVGIGFGEIGDLARLEPGYHPFRWRLESGIFVSFKRRDGDTIIPYQDYFFILSLPGLTASHRLRLDIRPAFTDESTLKFFGIGNATPRPAADVSPADQEYGRIHPTLSIEARYRFYDQFYVLAGSVYTHNWMHVRSTSLLAQAQASGSPEVRAILGSFDSHGVELLETGLQYDSRDNETVTRRGQFHSAVLRVSPKVGATLPYGYERITLTARYYTTPVPRWLTLSGRLVADTLLGDPPFYELARFDETPAIGGSNSIRGVPSQRYYGKVKLFGNVEARSDVFPFKIHGKPMVLGLAVFADFGRTWTELGKSHPELDGSGIGLKYGLGGGLRLQQGQTFIVRADLAWSPDARPVGAYFTAGEIF